jgi:CubicO group peptidase (beta-lactamase class C family)
MNLSRRSVLAGLAASTAALPAAAQVSPAARQRIAQEAWSFIQRTGAPGLSVALARGGELGFSEAWGFADLAGTPLSTNHRFRIASVSKPVTAAATMMLAEREVLSVDDLVFGPNGWLGFAYGPVPPMAAGLRVRHLLSHTCGGWTNDGSDPTMNHVGLSNADLIAHTLQNHPLIGRPGTTQLYSNFGYFLLGRIIEQATSRPYEDWVREELLIPCGAAGMRIGGSTRAPDEVGYRSSTGDDPWSVDIRRLDANGGWIANPVELIRFITRVDGYPGEPDILHANTTRSMATGPFPGAAFGHGWQINQWDNWWHTGILPGTSAFLCRTSSGYAFAALANVGGPGSEATLLLDQMMWRMAAAIDGWTP